MKELLLYMAKSLVDDPDSVTVTEIEGETTVLELRVAPEDMGKLIGRQGRIAKEIRTIMKSVAQRNGKKVSVEIVDWKREIQSIYGGTMLNNTGFDQWADEYDRSVARSDAAGSYPFAGYQEILDAIVDRVTAHGGGDVLDIGFGTGTLTARLYAQGCCMYGQDFSERMVQLAQEKMPDAKLYSGDFKQGLVEPLRAQRYDFILATYSLHHLTDAEKVLFLNGLLALLKEDGEILIGDVAFRTRVELEACKTQAGASWDEDEIYFVADELAPAFPQLKFVPFSACAGILSLRR